MGSAVRVEATAFSDPRFGTLARLAGFADADHARGKVEHLWSYCTDQQSRYAPVEIVKTVIGPQGVEHLVAASLGSTDDALEGFVRIRGTKGRIEWLGKLRKNAVKGGKARASQKAAAKKTQKGTLLAAQPELPLDPKPSPPATAPALAPVPALSPEREPGPTRPPGADPRFLDSQRSAVIGEISQLHIATYNACLADLGLQARPMQPIGDPAERALVDLLRSMPSMDGVLDDCKHVLEVRLAEARRTRSVKFLGASVWNQTAFGKAKTMTLEEAQAAPEGRTSPQAGNGGQRRRGAAFDALFEAGQERDGDGECTGCGYPVEQCECPEAKPA